MCLSRKFTVLCRLYFVDLKIKERSWGSLFRCPCRDHNRTWRKAGGRTKSCMSYDGWWLRKAFFFFLIFYLDLFFFLFLLNFFFLLEERYFSLHLPKYFTLCRFIQHFKFRTLSILRICHLNKFSECSNQFSEWLHTSKISFFALTNTLWASH